ncbi:hypothetical protein Tco_0818922 [Tanacetum coccineum]
MVPAIHFSRSRRETTMKLYSTALGSSSRRQTHDLISYLKLKGFPSHVGITLLTITGSLNTALDLNYFLSRLVDESPVPVSDYPPTSFSPAIGGSTLRQYKPLNGAPKCCNGNCEL